MKMRYPDRWNQMQGNGRDIGEGGSSVWGTCAEWKGGRRWDSEIVVRRSRKLRWEKEEGRRGRELSATLLPVLVKCCVLSKRQPRMCQPSRLTLPNGLLNADIKLTRSFALPFSSPSLPLFLPLTLPLITSRSHPVTHSVTHLSSLSLFLSFCCSINLSLSAFPFLRLLPAFLKFSCRLSLYLQLVFHGWTQHFCLSFFFFPTGSIMPSTHWIHPSLWPFCTSCQRHSTAWPMPLSLAWIGTGGVYWALLACRYWTHICILLSDMHIIK